MQELLLSVLIHPLCMPVLAIILSVLSIPLKYLGLWNAGIITIWSIFLFPLNRPYVDAHWDFFGELIIAGVNFFLFIAIVLQSITRLLDKQEIQKSENIKLLKILTLSAYGILAAYHNFLFFTDFWHNYQPAWQAYITIIVGCIITITFGFLIKKYAKSYNFINLLHNLTTFIYSFAISIIVILFASLVFPIIIRKETNKIIQQAGDRDFKYYIQSNRKSISNWLYLSPLTAWNKPNGSRGSGSRHAVLVIEKNNDRILYYWSYKLRQWEFVSRGFKPDAFLIPDSLKCTLKINYLNRLPFWSS